MTGKPKRVFFYGKTRQEVAEKLSTALNNRMNGTFVEPNKVTVGKWLKTWLENYMKPHLRPTTWQSYEALMSQHVIPAIGEVKLKNLQTCDLQGLYKAKLESGRLDRKGGLSARTVRYIHSVVFEALEQAVKEQLVVRNVAEAVTLPREEKKEIQPLTSEQVGEFLASIRDERHYPALLLELSTGLRRGELLALRWEDVDLKAGNLKVRQSLVRIHSEKGAEKKTELVFQEPKTKHSKRTIPLTAGVLKELKAHKARQAQEKLFLGQGYQDNGLVFCMEDGRPIEPRNFTRRFDGYLERAGIPHVRFHDLRHTFATLMLELDEHPKVVQEILGHSKISMTIDTYSHVMPGIKERAMAKLDSVLKPKEKPSAREGI